MLNKRNLAKKTLNIYNEEVSKILKKMTAKLPMLSNKEIRAGTDRFLTAYKSGDKTRFISQEELEKKT